MFQNLFLPKFHCKINLQIAKDDLKNIINFAKHYKTSFDSSGAGKEIKALFKAGRKPQNEKEKKNEERK